MNYDSIIKLINKEESIDEKCNIYYNSTPYYSISEEELKSFNQQLLNKINQQDREYFELATMLIEGLFYSHNHQYDSSEIKYNRLINRSKNNDIQFYIEGINGLALLYLYQDKFEESIKLTDKAISMPKNTIPKQNLGLTHQYRGATYRAMDFLNLSTREFLIADSLLPENGDKVSNYLDLGTNYGILDDFESAEKYFIKARELSKALKDDYSYYHSLIQFGILHQKKGDIKKSDSFLLIAKEYFVEIEDTRAIIAVESDLNKNFTLKENYSKAIEGIKKQIQSHFYKDDPLYLSICYEEVARNYVYLKKSKLAKTYLDSAFLLWETVKTPPEYFKMLDTKKSLSKLEGNYQLALEIDVELDSLKEIQQEKSNINKAKELQYIYETEKRERENLTLKTEKAQVEKEKQSQFYQLLIGIILLSLGLIVVYLRYKNRQKRNTQLEELDSLKSRFFESISHELRTPLTLIQLPVSKALEKRKPVSEKELRTIKYNTKRLQNLMDDLLSITRIEANKYPISITENNVTKQTQIQTAQFDSLAESNGIEYIKKIGNQSVLAKYDKEVYTKILVNLVSNAIKYSDNGGKVTVDFEVKNNKAFLVISDEGRGIRKEDQQYIFDKFYRVDQHNENVPGSGIGLSIVKELLGIIGGSISFESEEGKGTQFFVEFPLDAVEIATETFSLASSLVEREKLTHSEKSDGKEIEYDIDNAEKPILLVVEDNEELLSYIQKEFSEDFKVMTANNGKLGIEKGLEMVPDLIISDWLMPEKNGIELCEAIKQNEITSHIPVVMLTAKTEIEDKIKGFETGADAYIAKPFEMSVLNAQVQSMIHQRKKIFEKFKSEDTQLSTQEFSKRDLEFWNKLKTSVDNNLSNPDFSVQALAEELFVSRMQLNRKLKALISISGSEYILNTKMKLAKNLLRNKDLQISEIGYKIGYDNSRSFARAFKKETGKTPSEYRKD